MPETITHTGPDALPPIEGAQIEPAVPVGEADVATRQSFAPVEFRQTVGSFAERLEQRKTAVSVAVGSVATQTAERPGETATTEEPKKRGPVFKFVFWKHVPENGEAAAKELADCDVLGLEMWGGSEKHRAGILAAFTTALSVDATEQERKEARWRMPLHYRDLAEHLPRRGQRVVALDVNEDHPAAQEGQHIWDVLRLAALYSVGASNKAIKRALVSGYRHGAAKLAQRESETVSQLQALAADPDNAGKRIGVVYGSVHTPLQHILARTAQTERRFVDVTRNPAEGASERLRYTYGDQISRQLRLKPDSQIAEPLLNRALLANTFLVNYKRGLPGDKPMSPELLDERADPDIVQVDIVSKMTDREVTDLLSALDAVKHPIRGLFKRRQMKERQVALLEAARAQMAARESISKRG